MKILFINIILAFVWATVTASFTVPNLFIGFVLGYLILLFTRPVIYNYDYIGHVGRAIWLVLYFFYDLFVSSIRVAIDVVKPSLNMRSAVVYIPLDVKTDVEITMFANMISLTPGTLSLDVSDDRTKLYIHAMYVDTDVDAIRDEYKQGLETRILRVLH